MGERRLSDPEREWLTREEEHWRSAGLLSAEQGRRILELYESPEESARRREGRGSFVLVSLSVFLVGLAALLLIGYNWNGLNQYLKVAIVLTAVAGTHGCGLLLRNKWNAPKLAEVVFFLGCLFYGSGIWLIAQAFHLDAHYPDGLWWWALGVLPFAMFVETKLLHFLYAALLAAWAGCEVLGFSHLWYWNFPNGAYSLPLLAAPGIIWAYRRNSAGGLAIYLPLIAWWVALQGLGWGWEQQAVYVVGFVGALYLLLAQAHRPGSKMAAPYRVYGALYCALGLIPLSFRSFHRNIYYPFFYSARQDHASYAAFVMLALAVAMISVMFLLRRRGDKDTLNPLAGLGTWLREQWLPLGVTVILVAMMFWFKMGALATQRDFYTENSWFPALLANVGMVALAIWLMKEGLHENRGRLFSAGVVYFLLWAVLRYADLFGDVGMLGGALIFFLCGALLFGLAMLWRKRKELKHA